jgi:hypothetical protein
MLARLGKHQMKTGKLVTRLHQRRLVAVLGDINALNLAYNLKLGGKELLVQFKSFGFPMGARVFGDFTRMFCGFGAIGVLDFYRSSVTLSRRKLEIPLRRAVEQH